jgi:hypothetical protein
MSGHVKLIEGSGERQIRRHHRTLSAAITARRFFDCSALPDG